MIFVVLKHPHSAIEHACRPQLRVGRVEIVPTERGVKAMGFKVGFVDSIEPEGCTQLVEPLRVGVVGHAHGIEVGLLHQKDVGHHRLLANHLHVLPQHGTTADFWTLLRSMGQHACTVCPQQCSALKGVHSQLGASTFRISAVIILGT